MSTQKTQFGRKKREYRKACMRCSQKHIKCDGKIPCKECTSCNVECETKPSKSRTYDQRIQINDLRKVPIQYKLKSNVEVQDSTNNTATATKQIAVRMFNGFGPIVITITEDGVVIDKLTNTSNTDGKQ